MIINNLPKELKDHIVYRESGGARWYWGTYNDEFHARMIAEEIHGYVITKEFLNEKGYTEK